MDIAGLSAGDVVPLGRTHSVRAHDSTHRVPARAWEFLELRHHLKPQYAALDGAELGRLRRQGLPIHDEVQHSVLFYTGDTDRGILERNESLFRAEVLMIECSFVGENHRDRAARYRHIHFDDIAEFAERYENSLIVLTHFSRRYSREEIVGTIRQRCPASLRDRLRLALAPPYDRL
jgi:ribonuclease Z